MFQKEGEHATVIRRHNPNLDLYNQPLLLCTKPKQQKDDIREHEKDEDNEENSRSSSVYNDLEEDSNQPPKVSEWWSANISGLVQTLAEHKTAAIRMNRPRNIFRGRTKTAGEPANGFSE